MSEKLEAMERWRGRSLHSDLRLQPRSGKTAWPSLAALTAVAGYSSNRCQHCSRTPVLGAPQMARNAAVAPDRDTRAAGSEQASVLARPSPADLIARASLCPVVGQDCAASWLSGSAAASTRATHSLLVAAETTGALRCSAHSKMRLDFPALSFALLAAGQGFERSDRRQGRALEDV